MTQFHLFSCHSDHHAVIIKVIAIKISISSPDIWPVLIETHISNKQNFPAINEPRKGAVDWDIHYDEYDGQNNDDDNHDEETFFAPGCHAGPVAEEALGCVVSLQHVTVSTLSKIEVRC